MIDTFMFCDVRRFELSARGTMTGHAASEPLASAIESLPGDSVAEVDLVEIDGIDAGAVARLAGAIDGRLALGSTITIRCADPVIVAALAVGGLDRLLTPVPLQRAS